MPSDTVWLEQVDTGLIDFIQDVIEINDEPIKCKVRKPDEDFKTETYPFVSIYNLFSRRDDFRRHHNGDIIVLTDKEQGINIEERPGLPYNLFYQIDFWAQYQTHLNSMLFQWLHATNGGKDFNLPLETAGGEKTSRFCLCTDDFRRQDFMQDTKRILHSTVTYRIYAEIDEHDRRAVSLYTTQRITTTRKG